MKKTLCSLVLLSVLLHSTHSIGAPKLNTKAKKIVASIRMPASFVADFVYINTSGEVKKEKAQEEYQIEGKIWVKGNKYKVLLEDQIVVGNGETVWSYVPSLQEVQIYNEQPIVDNKDNASFSPIELLHLYKNGFFPVYYQPITIGKKQYDQIELRAKDQENGVQQLILDIDRTTKHIKRMQVFEKDGTVHNFSLINLILQNKLTDAYFEFQMPTEEIEVVDLR